MSDMSDYRQSPRIIISPESKSSQWPHFTFYYLPDPQILRKWDAGLTFGLIHYSAFSAAKAM